MSLYAQRSPRRVAVARAQNSILRGGTIPPPYKGWNAASPLEDMDPAMAIILDNWFPEPAFVRFRGGHIQHSSTTVAGNDAFTKVLLPFTGADAGTVITDTNVGGSAHVWTANGNANTDNAQFKFGPTSLACDGTGDYVSTPDSADFTLGSSDFTADCWFNCTAAGGVFSRLAAQCDSLGTATTISFIIRRNSSNVMVASAVVGAVFSTVTGTTQFTNALNPGWHYLAFVRIGDILRLFIDGVQEGGDVAITGTVNDSANALAVGRNGEITTETWSGWIDEWRLSVGIARDPIPSNLPYETSPAGPIESLMAYHGPAAVQRLFAARGSRIYDVTAAAAMEAVLGLTNARWQHINFTTPGGSFLYIVNGADDPRHFNGTVWATPVITGITASQAIHINAHKNRIWFVLINSTNAAYLPTSSIAGAAQIFPLGPLMTKGGHLVAMGTWTMDSGWGPDDFAVFITSRGQVIVYAGTDPANANEWILKGVYDIGIPIGRRCLTKVGGDLAVITVDGVVSLSQAISMDRSTVNRSAITARIQKAMNAAAQSAQNNFGWQLITYPKGTASYLNVPITENVQQYQFVMNTLTGAWCRYIGMNGSCWELFMDNLYFGGNTGIVMLSDRGGTDNGTLIVADMKTAFNYLGDRGSPKRFPLMRALMRSDGTAIPDLTLNPDYQDFAPETLASPFVGLGARWNQFFWNDGSLWSGGTISLADWVSATAIGYCVAMRMKITPDPENPAALILLEINGFDIKWERSTGAL
jgi:hypothetical protein